VSKVPDLGGPDAAFDEHGIGKRRFGMSSLVSYCSFGHLECLVTTGLLNASPSGKLLMMKTMTVTRSAIEAQQ
jgi:hypothetical protein